MTLPINFMTIFAQNSPRPCLPALGKIVAPMGFIFSRSSRQQQRQSKVQKAEKGPHSTAVCAKMCENAFGSGSQQQSDQMLRGKMCMISSQNIHLTHFGTNFCFFLNFYYQTKVLSFEGKSVESTMCIFLVTEVSNSSRLRLPLFRIN